ncbi:hypothetical protein EK21DRAFT_86778 [Setomelanomma holmii]|uniref:Uncharacterized protein n=1 Tax=Setomelanomma holmii TaxID=210430 RepID=A0A9P4LMJ6_9PLEO|nr:hypothetical protein EK21DRAFT_86778 [Setomelanomma holmii]
MSFPLDIIPMMDAITGRRVAAERENRDGAIPPKDDDRIHQWQAGMRNETLAEKPLPNENLLPESPDDITKAEKAWRKVKETFRPKERKKHRAKEFDELMRSGSANVVVKDDNVSWRTMFTGAAAAQGMTSRMFLDRYEGQDAVHSPRLQGIEEEEDEITALPSMPPHLLSQVPIQKERRRIVKKARSTMF